MSFIRPCSCTSGAGSLDDRIATRPAGWSISTAGIDSFESISLRVLPARFRAFPDSHPAAFRSIRVRAKHIGGDDSAKGETAMRMVQLQKREQDRIHICCVCGEVRDDVSGAGAWHDLQAHMRLCGTLEKDTVFSHTFCPICLMAYERQLGLGYGLDNPQALARAGIRL